MIILFLNPLIFDTVVSNPYLLVFIQWPQHSAWLCRAHYIVYIQSTAESYAAELECYSKYHVYLS